MSDAATHRNRLCDEPSLYLRQHGHNPVDWFPWCTEALELARAEDKPILLSIGYSSCHWCHVMERESFEDERIAALMNDLFVCIKVDREERPDLDNVYMKTVQLMTGRGGWPMTVFLRPDLKPFYAGTYFPPEDRGNMAGFPRVLVGVERAYRNDADKVGERAEQVVEILAGGGAPQPVGDSDPLGAIAAVAEKLSGVMDPDEGGFGSAPKFPNTLALSFLLEAQAWTDDAQYEGAVKLALDKMAAGGVYDHLGGGFHRYSVDSRWLVPHFEKMLYDQALLADLYVEGLQYFGEPAYRKTLYGIADYVCREMSSEGSAYFANQDADSEGVEGKFFVWTREEVVGVVGEDDADLVCRYFDVSAEGNFEGQNILHPCLSIGDCADEFGREPAEIRDVVDEAARALFERRAQRIAPVTDRKHLTDWNGLMIGAMAKIGSVLDEERFIRSGQGAADFVRSAMSDGDRLLHFYAEGTARVPAFLDDYAFFGRGCLELFFAGGREEDLISAKSCADTILSSFEDGENGGFYFTAEDAEAPLLRSRELADSAVPSGNAVATELLLRLWQLTGDDCYRIAGESALKGLLPSALANPHGGAHLLNLALKYRKGFGVVVVSMADSPEGQTMVRRGHELHTPEVSILAIDGEEPAWLPAPVRGKVAGDGPAAALCRGTSCLPPAHSADELEAVLRTQIGAPTA